MPKIFVEEYEANKNKQKSSVVPKRVESIMPIPKLSEYVAPKTSVAPGRVESIMPIPKLNEYTTSKPTVTPKATIIPNATGTAKPSKIPVTSSVTPKATVIPNVTVKAETVNTPVAPTTVASPKKGTPTQDARTLESNIYHYTAQEPVQTTNENRPQPMQSQPMQDQLQLYQTSGNVQNQQSDIEARINALNQAKQAQAVAELGKARDTQLSNLVGEEAVIKPMYYDKRNSAAASNMMGRRTLAEELAARGELKSGVADEANIRANMSLQGETGLLNRQEASDIADIASRRTGVQNAYESDVVSAKANLEALAMQNLIDQYNADRAFKLQESGVTGLYNGNQTMQAQGQYFNQNMATKQFEQAKTQQDIDNIFRQTQADIGNALNNRQITNQEAQQLLDNLFRDKTFAEQTRQFNVGFDYQQQRDTVSDSQWQQSLNLDLRKQTFNETQAQIENAFTMGQISRAEADLALQQAKFNAEQDPNSLDNQIKKATLDANTYSKNASVLNDIIQRLDGLYTYKDVNGVPTRNPNYSDAQLRSAIIGLNLSDDQTDTLLLRYGLPIN